MTTFPKEEIKKILEGLDQKNDALWTDDGSPLVSEIQRLADDKTITRSQITEALPGFARKSKVSLDKPDEPGIFDDEPVVEAKNTHVAPVSDEDGFLTEEEEHERVKVIAHNRVQDAELAYVEAKAAVAEAYQAQRRAEQRLTRAHTQYNSKFPPISAAANIKQHLARQQEVLRARVAGTRYEPTVSLNPVDARLMDRKRDNGRNGKGPGPAPFLPRKASLSY